MKFEVSNRYCGSSGVGTFTASYDDIVGTFGKPTGVGDPCKTDAEWGIRFADEFATYLRHACYETRRPEPRVANIARPIRGVRSAGSTEVVADDNRHCTSSTVNTRSVQK